MYKSVQDPEKLGNLWMDNVVCKGLWRSKELFEHTLDPFQTKGQGWVIYLPGSIGTCGQFGSHSLRG